jgi:hypothetical protein
MAALSRRWVSVSAFTTGMRRDSMHRCGVGCVDVAVIDERGSATARARSLPFDPHRSKRRHGDPAG